MAILQLSLVSVGQVGVRPASYKMVSTNTVAEIKAPGYLKQGAGGQYFNRNDLIEAIYSANTPSQANTFFYVTINQTGVITLNDNLVGGLGTAAFKAASNNSLATVSSVSGATVVNRIPKFSDTTGTIVDSGIPIGTASGKNASDNSQGNVASIVTANQNTLAVFADNSGSLYAPGIQIESNMVIQTAQDGITAAFGGQPTATPLTAQQNGISEVPNPGDGVLLPSPVVGGLQILVVNHGLNQLAVYPFAGDQIDALGPTNPFSLNVGKSVLFFCITPGQWWSLLSA